MSLVDLQSQSPYFSRGNKYPEHIKIALQYENHREIKPNRSAFIDSANKFVGSGLASPYCCASACFWINKSHAKSPRLKTGLSTKFKSPESFSALEVLKGNRNIKAGDILTWQRGTTIFGHTGLAIEDWKGNKGMTIQANTSSTIESSEGEGIFVKSAKLSPLAYFRIVRITPVRY